MNGKFPAAVNRFRRCRVDHDQFMRLTIHQEQLLIAQNLEPIFAMERFESSLKKDQGGSSQETVR